MTVMNQKKVKLPVSKDLPFLGFVEIRNFDYNMNLFCFVFVLIVV